jgi:hypothetical protein
MQLPMAMAMAMAMAMMSSERKPPSMPPSQDEAHTMIGNFTNSTVSNSGNELHLILLLEALRFMIVTVSLDSTP